ncbi:ATP-dependent DNA helicase RecQ [Parvularcula marina]|uniref:RecQ family ATP-dependent DNA helicase n=1 Tax=Parvularcula marina TaxID=2292771 RepID=UPI0035126399
MSATASLSETQTGPDQALAALGHAGFREGQEEVINAILAGRNVLALMPTGAGKSLCYQLPALLLPGLTVVISPLIALMENQIAALRAKGIPAGMIHSGRDREANVADWKAAAAGELKLLYMSPERLMTGRMLGALRRQDLSLIAIDEAHCVSQWGHQFRPEYRQLGRLKEVWPDVPVAAFTATADPETREDILQALFEGNADLIRQGFDRPNISLNVAERERDDRVLMTLMRRYRRKCGIVYCRTRKSVELVTQRLAGARFNVAAYHAGLPEEERLSILERFISAENMTVVATVAFGMGIDKPDIDFVIHRDLPASLEAYYQEIGRSGRDGREAEAHLIFGIGDLIARRRLIDGSDALDKVKRVERRRLDALVAFCETDLCRRAELLRYFGEEPQDACGNCDLCVD